MVHISTIIKQFIERNPFIADALSRGIINHAALAEELRPAVEKELGKPVKFSAINMAIRRYSETMSWSSKSKASFNPDADITVQGNLVGITVYKTENVHIHLRKLYDLVDYRNGDFLIVTQGLHEVMIITNQKHYTEIGKLFPEKIIKKTMKGLGCITIAIAPECTETVGLYYLVTRALAWEQINIIDLVSTFTEMTFILETKDISHAYKILNDLVTNSS